MNRGCKYGIGLTGVILLLFIANLLIGSVNIPPADVWHILTGGESSKASWSFIVWEARLPQALTALLCGGPGRVRAHAADSFQEPTGRSLHSGY